MASLGQMLANNIANESKNAVPEALQAEMARLAVIRRRNETGERFFTKAREYFTNGIQAGVSMKTLRLKVGDGGYDTGEDTHMDVHAELDWIDRDGRRHWSTGMAMPAALTDEARFADSWNAFKAWSFDNGLEPVWERVPLSYGTFYLCIKPCSGLVADETAEAAPPHDVPVAWYRTVMTDGGGREDRQGKYKGKVFETNPHVVGFGQYQWHPLYGRPARDAESTIAALAQRVVTFYRDKAIYPMTLDKAVEDLAAAIANAPNAPATTAA